MSAKNTREERELEQLGITDSDLAFVESLREQADDTDSSDALARKARRQARGFRRSW